MAPGCTVFTVVKEREEEVKPAFNKGLLWARGLCQVICRGVAFNLPGIFHVKPHFLESPSRISNVKPLSNIHHFSSPFHLNTFAVIVPHRTILCRYCLGPSPFFCLSVTLSQPHILPWTLMHILSCFLSSSLHLSPLCCILVSQTDEGTLSVTGS